MGLRQLRHALQGVRHPRHAPDRAGEDRRRRPGAPPHRPRADRGPAHPVGPRRRLGRPQGARGVARRRARDGEQQHLPGRRLQARQPDPRRPRDPRQGGAAQPALPGDHARDRVARPQDLAGRRHQLPGQDDIRARQDRLAESLAEIYAQVGEDQRLVLEYKFFEPAFYHTDVPDWGTSYVQVQALGERAVVCLDTGHHAPAPTSSSSSPSCCGSGSSAPSTSTAASTPTTTSSSARPTRSSCSGSSSRSSAAAGTARAPTSR